MSRLVDPDEVGSSSASSSTSSTTSRAPSTAARPASTASVQRGSGRSSSSSSSGGGGGVDEPEEPPSHLNTIERLMFLDVSKDKLTATYVGKGHHPQDVGVRATPSSPYASRRVLTHSHSHPIHLHNRSLRWDRRSLLAGHTSQQADDASMPRGVLRGRAPEHVAAVGSLGRHLRSPLLAVPSSRLGAQVRSNGSHSHSPSLWRSSTESRCDSSYGYHGRDGNKFASGRGESFGPKFVEGDVIGCGIHYQARHVFFTRNGEIIGSYSSSSSIMNRVPSIECSLIELRSLAVSACALV